MRPTKEIQAERTLSFFSLLVFLVAVGRGRRCLFAKRPGRPDFFRHRSDPTEDENYSKSTATVLCRT